MTLGSRRVDGLDVLRGLAIAFVLLRHATDTRFGGAGLVGVAVFFTLSGYLITGLLRSDLARFGRIRFGRFYRNRVLRLVPALLCMVLVFSLVEAVWAPLRDRAYLAESDLVAMTYTSDLRGPWQLTLGFDHLWTLSIEEQFYLVWPALLAVAAVLGWRLGRVAVAAAAVLSVVCWVMVAAESHGGDVYARPSTWAAAMAIGGAAQVYDSRIEWAPLVRRLAAAGGMVVLLGLAVYPHARESRAVDAFGAIVVGVATVAVILEVSRWETVPGWLRPGVWLGQVSYGAYLWNMPILMWTRAIPLPPHWHAFVLLATIPATLLAAAASWYTVEAAGRRWRARLDARSRTTPVGFAARPQASG